MSYQGTPKEGNLQYNIKQKFRCPVYGTYKVKYHNHIVYLLKILYKCRKKVCENGRMPNAPLQKTPTKAVISKPICLAKHKDKLT